jgi:hypothetical protein
VAAAALIEPMQNSMQRLGPFNVSKEQQMRVLSELASGNLATFQSQVRALAEAFPNIMIASNGPPMVAVSYDDFSIEMIKALASASSRGTQVITPLSGSGASSSTARSSSTTIGSRLSQHQDTLMSVVLCMTLYHCYMEYYVAASMHNKQDMRRTQVELAVAAKSAGACTYLCMWLQ